MTDRHGFPRARRAVDGVMTKRRAPAKPDRQLKRDTTEADGALMVPAPMTTTAP